MAWEVQILQYTHFVIIERCPADKISLFNPHLHFFVSYYCHTGETALYLLGTITELGNPTSIQLMVALNLSSAGRPEWFPLYCMWNMLFYLFQDIFEGDTWRKYFLYCIDRFRYRCILLNFVLKVGKVHQFIYFTEENSPILRKSSQELCQCFFTNRSVILNFIRCSMLTLKNGYFFLEMIRFFIDRTCTTYKYNFFLSPHSLVSYVI